MTNTKTILFTILSYILSTTAFILFSPNVSFAALHINCFDSGTTVTYQNIYHEGAANKVAQNALLLCYGIDSYTNAMSQILSGHTGSNINLNWRNNAEYLEQVFPIYNPKQKSPVLIQTVISGTGYVMIISKPLSVILGYRDKCAGIRLSYEWMDIICGHSINRDPNRKDLYVLSQQEPYKSAPLIQFYFYKLGMLLVARDTAGMITHWTYERKDMKITNQQIQSFLGDKWYHP